MYLLEQKPANETTTEISIDVWVILLIIVLAILTIVGVFFLLKRLNKDDKDDEKYEMDELKQKKKKSFPWIILITIIILWSIVFIPFFVVTADTHNTTSAITRDITKSDYTYTTSQDLTAYQITIVPKQDFKSCSISLTLYDKNNSKVFSDTITKNDLTKNKPYTYTFEFGFINSLSGTNITFNVTGKCYID